MLKMQRMCQWLQIDGEQERWELSRFSDFVCVVNLIFLELDFWIQMRKGMVWTTHKSKHNVTRTQTFHEQGHCQFVVLF